MCSQCGSKFKFSRFENRIECCQCGEIIECCQCENQNITNQLNEIHFLKMKYTKKDFRFFELFQVQTLSPNLAQHILRLSLVIRNCELVISKIIEDEKYRQNAVQELIGRFKYMNEKTDQVATLLRRYSKDPTKYDDNDDENQVQWSDETFEEVRTEYEKITFGGHHTEL